MIAANPASARSNCSPTRILRSPLLALAAVVLCLCFADAVPAFAGEPWWGVYDEVVPTQLTPAGEGEVIVAVSNLGDVPAEAAKAPLTVTDTLPAGLTATAISGQAKAGSEVQCPTAKPPTPPLACTFSGTLYPYERLELTIKVKVEEPSGTGTSLPDEVKVEGGGAPAKTSTLPISVSEQAAQFGMHSYELAPFSENGSPGAQAGSHPFQLTTTLVLNQTAAREPIAQPKDLRFNLPSGLVGNPNAATQCTLAAFDAVLPVSEVNLCPPSSVVGVATVAAFEPAFASGVVIKTVPVFNLIPQQGEPARFGLDVIGKIPIVIDTSVRSGRDYGVVAEVRNATQVAGLLSSQVTLWGVPADPRHNQSRGWECVAGGAFQNQIHRSCPATTEPEQKPFLTLPTSCAANPLAEPFVSSIEADSWAQPGDFQRTEYAWIDAEGQDLGLEGCPQLPFAPSIGVVPEEHTASTPTGLTVDVRVPQTTTLEAEKLAEADVRDTTVTLPPGVQLSPSAANRLVGCSEAQVGFLGLNAQTQTDEFVDAQAACPDASKVGIVHIKTPLLAHELEGSVYLASPAPNREAGQNPSNSLVALYIVAEDPVSGVLVKLAGEGVLNEGTLRVATTFRNAPQVPFEELTLELFGGPRASVSTPAFCGYYATEGAFTPWSGTGPVEIASPAGEFDVGSGAGGAGCPGSSLPFAPGLVAQSESAQAGAFTSFALEVSRPDGDQALAAVTVNLPPGNAAMLSSVTLCSEAQANADACPPGSEVGQATAVAGLGSEPYVESGGRVYITGPYDGAPFGLEIVTPAVAGPFNLGYVVVRSKIYVNPNTAAITIVTPSLPTQLRGIPLQLKHVLVSVDRPNFEFNPTNCTPMKIEGALAGSEGASATVSSPFQVGGCQALPFAPKLSAVAGGRGSKADGTSLDVTVSSGGVGSTGAAQAGIAKVDLQLPVALSSRLSTLQKACTETTFNANPASCNEASVIGYATIHTPVLSNPLSGPAYLVSHGGAAFPDVEFVLQGEGIMLVLDGKTDIKHGITYSRFESAPDAPFTVFETVLPAGPHSVLTPNVPEREGYSLCKTSLAMPTEITGQNGVVINQNTSIALTGCGGVLSSRAKLTHAQLLAKALKVCRKKYNHAHSKRAACEKRARKKYVVKAAKSHAPKKK